MARKNLCRPCAAALEEGGKTVKPVGGRSEKITCDRCGFRRYGIAYDVTGRLRKKEGGTK